MFEAHVNKRLGGFQLDVALSGHQGVVGLFGPSGSGKTTLLNCIAGIARPDAGRILLDGNVLFDAVKGIDVRVRERRIGYVFQDSLLFPHLTVRDNLRFGMNHEGAGSSVRDVAELLEIGALLSRFPRELSGGEQRRVSIGRAVLSNPRLLLLDEPLTGLDAALAARVLDRLRQLIRMTGVPTLYVSHTLSDLLFLCDEAVVLRNGLVLARGPARTTLLKPDVLSAVSWSDLRNVFSVGVMDRQAAASGELALCRVGHAKLAVYLNGVPTGDVTLSIRAADIVISREKPTGLSARNIFSAVVSEVVSLGEKRLILLDAGASWMVEVSATAASELRLSPGAEVHLIVKTSSIAVC